jgi:TRAP-type C4-dicarboxylate transport system permease small subunit
MKTFRNGLSIVRDVLAIIIMIIFLWVGWNVVKTAHDVSERLNPPATISQLPEDECGGGIC